MLKVIIGLGLIVVVLVIGGVLEIKVHTEKIAEVPGKVFAFVSNPQTQAKAKATFTDLKRRGEQLIIQDEEKRTKLALLYVKEDAESLQRGLDENDASVEQLLPQAQLLAKSMERARQKLESSPIAVVAALKEDSRASLALAQESLKRLQEQREKYAAVQEAFAKLTSSLEESIKALVTQSGEPNNESSVAGTSDEKPEVTGDEPHSNAVPLNF